MQTSGDNFAFEQYSDGKDMINYNGELYAEGYDVKLAGDHIPYETNRYKFGNVTLDGQNLGPGYNILLSENK